MDDLTENNKTIVGDLLAVLSRPGVLDILEQARIGITASTDAHQRFGLTQKQYYSRLSQLIKAGLVEKVNGVYKSTKFGTLVWRKYLPKLEDVFTNSRK